MRLLQSAPVIFLACGAAACSDAKDDVRGFRSGKVAGPKLTELEKSLSRDPAGQNLLKEKKAHTLRFSRELLGQTFVWGGWIEKSDGSIYPFAFQSGLSLESVLVSFQLSPDGKWVHLFERGERDGEMLDRFPVVGSTFGEVEFDFAAGLPRRILRTWIGEPPATLQSSHSFVYDLDNSDGKVTFAQLLKLEDANLSTMILRHSFRPVSDDGGFPVVRLAQAWLDGFFPVRFPRPGMVEEFGAQPLRRFDISKPVKWYVSSSVPARFQVAVRNGILAWNEAFGRDVLQVEQLSDPVDWASSRLNVFHWRDEAGACGGPAAFGPSEANPVTGEIFSAKVLFCGGKFADLYEKAVDPTRHARDEFEQAMIRWATTHEVGHALGFSHNFLAKYFRDENDESMISSSVMDYPNPEDVMRIRTVGPRDKAMVRFSYLTPGDADALQEVRKYPLCDDDALETDPACTQFVRGLSPHALMDEYLESLEAGAATENDQRVVSVAMKQVLTREDPGMLAKLGRLLMAQAVPGAKVESLFSRYLQANSATLARLPPSYRGRVYRLLAELVASPGHLALSAGQLLNALADTKDPLCHQELSLLRKRIQEALRTCTEPDRQASLRILDARLREMLRGFWQKGVHSQTQE